MGEQQEQDMRLNRVDLAINMNRWYAVNVQGTLFHEHAVVCGWGRRGTDYARWRIIPVESPDQAEEMVKQIVRLKIKRGYELACTNLVCSKESGVK